MKKLVMTFAIVAFLIGGLSINANAQNKKPATTSKAKTETVQGKENYDQMLKDYETNINLYIEAYEKAMKAGNTTSDKTNFMTYQKKALDLQTKLEKAKDKMTQSQIDTFLKLKAKFAEALKRK